MIKNIIFDCSGTVLKFIAKDVLAKQLGDKERAYKIHSSIYNTPEWHEYGLDNITFEQMKERVFPRLDKNDRAVADEYLESRAVNYVEMDGMSELLELLKANGYKLYLLSNYPDYFDLLWNRFDLFRLFDGRCISYEEHASKSGDGRLYDIILEKYGLNATECIMIDDVRHSLESAKARGIKGFLFRSVKELKPELIEYGIKL